MPLEFEHGVQNSMTCYDLSWPHLWNDLAKVLGSGRFTFFTSLLFPGLYPWLLFPICVLNMYYLCLPPLHCSFRGFFFFFYFIFFWQMTQTFVAWQALICVLSWLGMLTLALWAGSDRSLRACLPRHSIFVQISLTQKCTEIKPAPLLDSLE